MPYGKSKVGEPDRNRVAANEVRRFAGSKVGEPDRNRVAANEVRRFAGKYDLSQEYVRDLIACVGSDRDELYRVAKELRVAASTL